MIELNLLPKELRKKKKPLIKAPKIPVLPIAVGILSVLIVMHALLSLFAINNRGLLKQLKNKWTQMKPQSEKTEKISKDITGLEKKLNVIRKIAKPKVDWALLLSGLNEAVIPNIWLSSFELKFKETGGGKDKEDNKDDEPFSLYLTGYALGKSEEATSRTAKFINSLKSAKNFSDYFDTIELENITSQQIAGEEVMIFKLDCRFKGTKSEGPQSTSKQEKAKELEKRKTR